MSENILQFICGRNKMRYWDAIQIVLDEAESSALGDNNQEVLKATEMVREWLGGLGESSDLLDFLLSAEGQ